MNKSPVKARILMHIRKMGISKSKFCKNTGITRGVLDIPSGISEENIAKYIACYPHINLDWVFTGKGPMFQPPKQGEAALYALQAEDPSIETLRTAKERAVEEAKDAWKKLAAAQQKITALTEAMSSIKEVVTQLRATSAELAKQLEPEEQLNYKNTQ